MSSNKKKCEPKFSAMYNLNFYKKQSSWKLSKVPKKGGRKSTTNKQLNVTYVIETKIPKQSPSKEKQEDKRYYDMSYQENHSPQPGCSKAGATAKNPMKKMKLDDCTDNDIRDDYNRQVALPELTPKMMDLSNSGSCDMSIQENSLSQQEDAEMSVEDANAEDLENKHNNRECKEKDFSDYLESTILLSSNVTPVSRDLSMTGSCDSPVPETPSPHPDCFGEGTIAKEPEENISMDENIENDLSVNLKTKLTISQAPSRMSEDIIGTDYCDRSSKPNQSPKPGCSCERVTPKDKKNAQEILKIGYPSTSKDNRDEPNSVSKLRGDAEPEQFFNLLPPDTNKAENKEPFEPVLSSGNHRPESVNGETEADYSVHSYFQFCEGAQNAPHSTELDTTTKTESIKSCNMEAVSNSEVPMHLLPEEELKARAVMHSTALSNLYAELLHRKNLEMFEISYSKANAASVSQFVCAAEERSNVSSPSVEGLNTSNESMTSGKGPGKGRGRGRVRVPFCIHSRVEE